MYFAEQTGDGLRSKCYPTNDNTWYFLHPHKSSTVWKCRPFMAEPIQNRLHLTPSPIKPPTVGKSTMENQ